MARTIAGRAFFAFCGAVLLALLAFGAPHAAAERAGRSAAPGELLVRFAPHALEASPGKAAVPASDTVERLRSDHGVHRVAPLLRLHGGRRGGVLERYGLDRIRLLRVDPGADLEALGRRLERDPAIEVAHPNWRIVAGAAPVGADTHYASQWPLSNTGQDGGTPDADLAVPEAWTLTVGRPETLVAVLDTGIDGDHREFRGRIAAGGWDVPGDDHDPEDLQGHGTRVWSIAGAVTNNDFAVSGINWRARVLPLRVLIGNGGTVGDLIGGLTLLATSGADLANLSLIGYRDTPLLRDAIAAAHDAGVILIGCNGNDGSDFVTYPAGFDEVLATGWTDRDDRRSPLSNHTPTLDVVAPGYDVPTVTFGSTDDTASPFEGCSAATPGATGVASLLLALDPGLTFEQLRDLLRATAVDEVGEPAEDLPGRDDYYGWGRIDAAAAVAALGLVSDGRIHVDTIALRRVDDLRLEVHVTVLDEWRGVEAGITVAGTLTTAEGDAYPLEGPTGDNGVAVLAFEPGEALPDGAFTFTVDSVSGTDREWAPDDDTTGPVTSDPLLDALRTGAVTFGVEADTLAVAVVVVDDDGVPEGGVEVHGRLTPPGAAAESMLATTRWAAGAVARFEYSPPGGLPAGEYTFEVLDLQKDGFVYAAARGAEPPASTHVLDPTADLDGDGVANGIDNCVALPNSDQADGDADGVGDRCDVCATLPDPAQRDDDGDGAGNRCDCGRFAPDRTGLAPVPLVFWDDAVTIRWHATSGADRYDVLRGALGSLDGADYGVCLAEDLTALARTDADLPPPGDGWFYLVRGDDARCGAGPLAPASATGPRVNTNPARCSPLLDR